MIASAGIALLAAAGCASALRLLAALLSRLTGSRWSAWELLDLVSGLLELLP